MIRETDVRVTIAFTLGTEYRGSSQDCSLSITRAKPVVNIRASTGEPAVEGDLIEFEVMRSSGAGDALTVEFQLDEDGVSTGVEAGDVLMDSLEGVTQSVTIAAGERTATVDVATTSDSVWENHSRIQMEIAVDDSYIIHGTEGSASVLVRDDEFVASVAELSVAPNPVGEGGGKTAAMVTVTTSETGAPHGRVTVPVHTANGTATAGTDFSALDTSLTFAESDFSGVEVDGNSRFRASKSVDVMILQDSLGEEGETFSVVLGSPSDSLVTLDADSMSTSVTITDDELPALAALTVSGGTLTPAFSSTGQSYTVPDVGYGDHLATISATPESGAEVSFLDTSGNDYDDLDDMAVGHQVYLNIGSTTIKIRVEKNGAMQDYTLVFARTKPTVRIRAVTTGHANEGDTLSFEVSRSEAAGDVLDVRVGMDELDVVEGEGHGDMLPDAVEGTSPLRTIEADETSLVFAVDTVGDVGWEKHSSIEMTVKAESRYEIDSDKGTASIVVQDDDFPDSTATLTVSPNRVGEGAEKVVATVTVTTDDARMPHGEVSIPVSTSGGTATAGEDYTAVDSSLVFKGGDFGEVEEDGDTIYRASKSVEISILDDDLDEDDETFDVELGTASQVAVDIDSGAGSVLVTINDENSKPVVTVFTTPSPPVVFGRGAISLDGTSSDSDGDTLTFSWTTSPENFGAFSNASSEDTTWTAPAPLSTEQAVTLILTVSDDGEPMGVTTAEVAATVRANQAPTVEIKTTADTLKGGETVMLGARVLDPENGVVRNQWSGGGIFQDASAKDTGWTAPDATNEVQIFTLTLTATDEVGLTASDSVVFTVPASNQKPTFSGSEMGIRSVDEGTASGVSIGAPVAAVDADQDTLTYTLGGVDAASFDIDGAGQISVAVGTTLDYEVKREYAVDVSVSDGRDKAGEIDHSVDTSLPVRISVGDEEEAGVVTFYSSELRVGEEVRVGVRDPDNYEPSNTTGSVADADIASWLWERSDGVDGPWTEITGPTTATYVPTADDKGKYLRVTASYTDRRGSGKSAIGVVGRVRAEDTSPLVVVVSPDMATMNGCTVITLEVTTSYTGSDVLSYSWSAYPNVGYFEDDSMGSATWSGPDPGESPLSVVLTLTVTDGGGMSATDSVLVTVRGEAAGTGDGE